MVDEQDWKVVHGRLTALARTKAAYDHEEPQWLLRARQLSVHSRLGYGSFFEYVERVFGYSPRMTTERLRVAETLCELPRTSAALRQGEVSWSAARELTRVATPETEQAWLASAAGQTVRQVERAVTGRSLGDLPTDPASQEVVRQVLRFEVSASTAATLRDAKSALVQQTGHHVSDDELIQALARAVLGGPTDEGRASYQMALTECERCRQVTHDGTGEAVPIEPEVADMARCDAQVIGRVDRVGTHVGADKEVSGPVSAHVGAPRASQTVPPAIRRQVLRRQRNQCVVPGCTHSAFVDLHHTELRSEGGTHDPDKLCGLCGAHHSRSHDGRLVITGTWSEGFVFEHADGTPYGQPPEPARTETFAQAFGALRGLGFPERQTRTLLEAVRQTHVGADVGTLVQAALRAAPVPGARETLEAYLPAHLAA